MNEEKILDAIGDIDDDIIEEAERLRALPKPKKHPNSRVLATAACAVLVLGLTLVTVNFVRNNLLKTEEEAYDAVLKSPEGTVPELLNRIPEEEADIEEDGKTDIYSGLTDNVSSASGAETVPETVSEAASDIVAEETVPSESMPDAAPEAETSPVGSVLKYPEVTVTVDYVFPLEGMEPYIHYAVPTVSVPHSQAVEVKINSGDAFGQLISEAEQDAKAVADIISDPEAPHSGFCYAQGEVTYVKSSPASLTLGYSNGIYEGGVHPFHRTRYYNFSLESGEMLGLSDVLDSGNPDAESILKQAVTSKLYAISVVNDLAVEQIFEELMAGKFYDKWYLTEDSLVLAFSQYDIADYASGAITVDIPYTEITGVINERFIPFSDTNGSVRIAEMYNTAPLLIAYGTVSHITIRASVYEWDSQPIVYYASRMENYERLNLGSYQNYWLTYNANDGFEYIPYENVPGNPPIGEELS